MRIDRERAGFIRPIVSLRTLTAVVLLVPCACNEERSGASSPSAGATTRPAKPAQVLSFPESLHVADASVTNVVERAMNACAKGDYDDFRLLWSARQKPLERGEFEAGWLAVQSIDVRALELIKLATKTENGEEHLDEHYVMLAEVRFDPQHPAGRKEPRREVVLLLAKEQQQWRLARAPAKIRTWIRERVTAVVEPSAPTVSQRPLGHNDSDTDGG